LANVSSWINSRFKTQIELNQRDDLLLQPGDKKISGTAARLSHGRAYHHLTLLIKPNLPILRRILQSPYFDKIETNATRSVRAKAVGQLIDVVPNLETADVIEVLLDGVQQLSNRAELIHVDSNEIKDEEKWNGVEKTKEELQSEEWIYGKSPKFTLCLNDQKVVVEHGTVVETNNELYTIGSFFNKVI